MGLLEKDKLIVEIDNKISGTMVEIEKFKREIEESKINGVQINKIVEEFNGTIDDLVLAKEKDRQSRLLQIEAKIDEKNLVIEDLNCVQRSFNELSGRLQRSREIIANRQNVENSLKKEAERLKELSKKKDENYEKLKIHAKEKVDQANVKVEEVKNSRAAEISKLQAMLKKAEMKVKTLEEKLDQKTNENQELTLICDELISKV